MAYPAVEMAGCSKCKSELTSEDLKSKLVCDRCQSRVCQTCSCLSSTELRCMVLNKRVLKFYCPSCERADDHLMVDKIVDSLRHIFDTELRAVKEENEANVSALSEQVANLIDSNKDLVRLLTSTSKVRGFSPTSPNKQTSYKSCKSAVAPMPPSTLHVQKQQPDGGATDRGIKYNMDGNTDSPIKKSATTVREHRKNFIRGTVPTPTIAVGSKQNTFAAVARRAHLYVGNVNPHASKESIVDYIKDRIPNYDFALDELPKRDEAVSRAYKLTVDFTLLSILNQSDFWPQGVIVKRFFQPKRKSQ